MSSNQIKVFDSIFDLCLSTNKLPESESLDQLKAIIRKHPTIARSAIVNRGHLLMNGATFYRSLEFLQVLVAMGGTVRKTTNSGFLIINYACFGGNLDTAKFKYI
jgi:hypothetical protein